MAAIVAREAKPKRQLADLLPQLKVALEAAGFEEREVTDALRRRYRLTPTAQMKLSEEARILKVQIIYSAGAGDLDWNAAARARRIVRDVLARAEAAPRSAPQALDDPPPPLEPAGAAEPTGAAEHANPNEESP